MWVFLMLMNRTIKFRVWYEYKKNIYLMHYFGLDSFNSDDGSQWIDSDQGYLGYQEMLECPIMQYTGLKDKNGKEVYESDFVRFNNDEQSFVFKVSWDQKRHAWDMQGLYEIDMSYCEIVGNIYENPQLLT
jgi:uncharacterized phage protein (TIGR01671 family)